MPTAPQLRLVRTSDGPPEPLFTRRLLDSCHFPAEGPLACAVSGGADSLGLLALAVEAGLDPVAYHVDHGLRPGSGNEVEVVRTAAERLGTEVVSLRVELSPGPNLEARARAARFAALPDDVATGHTADDRAETILINLLRGAGAAGLGAMEPGRRHPILSLRRADTRAVCRELGLSWFEDPSNKEDGPLRNKLRNDLLPRLTEATGRDLVPVLCRQAELLRDDEVLLDELAEAIDPTSCRQLVAAPAPLARRALRRFLREASGGPYPPDAAAIERVRQVAAGGPLACDVGAGLAVRRKKGRLVIEHPPGRGEP
jgi:tRNA(Ile)-lysidine synthase